MKRLLLVVSIVALVAGPALAGQPEGADQMSLPVVTVGGGPEAFCSAFAVCWDGSNAYCSGSSACSFVDSSCPGTRGYAKCDGVYTWCPPCPVETCSKESWPCSIDSECRPVGEPECQYCSCVSIWDRPIGECLCL